MLNNKIQNITTLICINYFLLFILVFCLLISLLPLHFTYKKSIALLFILVSVIVFCTSLRNLFYSSNKSLASSSLIALPIVFFIYIAMQIFPVPSNFMSTLSQTRTDIWESVAYGMNGFTTFSLNISGTIWFLIMLFCYLSIFILTLNLISTKMQFVLITFAIFALGVYQISFDVMSKYLGYQYISASEIDGHTYRLTGTFINSNNLSALINLSIAAGLALLVMLISHIKTNKILLNILLIGLVIFGEVILIYGSIKAGSDGGFLSLLVAVSLITIIFLLKRFNLLILFVFSCFGLCVLGLLIFYGGPELNLEGLTRSLTLSGRPVLWQDVISMWKDFPLFGIGAGAFEWVFLAYKSEQTSPLRIVNAHSGYLHLLVETGLIGALVLVMILYTYIKEVVNVVKNQPSKVYLIGALMTGLLAFLIHEIVENNLLVPGVAMPFFCLMALVLSLSKISLNIGSTN